MIFSLHIWYTTWFCCKIIKSKNDVKVKARTEFSNVWREYKHHSNPYIQGTTVPCDTQREEGEIGHNVVTW